MRDTPRTDASAYQVFKNADGLIMTPVKFARQLERELNAAKQERADFGALVDKLERELNAVKAENAAMRSAVNDAFGSIHDLLMVTTGYLRRSGDEPIISDAQLSLDKLQPFLK